MAIPLHGNDGLDVGKITDLISSLRDPAAQVEIFQGIDAGKQGDPLPERLDPRKELRRTLSLVPEPYRMLYDQPLAAGALRLSTT